MSKLQTCHGCHGTRVVPDGLTGRPRGWLALSVNVPPEIGKNGKPFLWVGTWCCVAYLAADMTALAEQEELARMGYDAEPPEYPARPPRRG